MNSELPNPLDSKYEGMRILNDRGIKEGLKNDLIPITPALNLNDEERFQPATLDVKIKEVDESDINFPIENEHLHWTAPNEIRTILAGSKANVILTETIDALYPHIFPLWEARSSLRRLGLYTVSHSLLWNEADGTHIELANFSVNDIHFNENERIAQIFFLVEPFKNSPKNLGDKVRKLDMGIELKNDMHVHYLVNKGLLDVSPELIMSNQYIQVTAGHIAYRIKKINGGIDFAKRKDYSQNELLEPIDISKGYEIKPYEHIIIETEQKFALSEKVGIWFWDNEIISLRDGKGAEMTLENALKNIGNFPFINMADGWIDPGYNGGFSRQPKWASKGRIVKPGDVLGFGQVFYFPNGVENPYGKVKGSQYQGDVTTKVSK